MLHTMAVQSPDLVKQATRAVEAALRPRAAESQRLLRAFELEHGAGVRAVQAAIEDSVVHDKHQERTVPFWGATGEPLTESLMAITGVDEDVASHIVGAALHALILAKQDTSPDTILRLAERAVCWDAGRQWAVASVVASGN